MEMCPICNKNILKGYIESPVIEWIPEGGSSKIVYSSKKTNGFRLGKHSFFDMKKTEAYFCEFCNKIIIECTV